MIVKFIRHRMQGHHAMLRTNQ